MLADSKLNIEVQHAWIPPPFRTLKCNCDAAFFVEEGITDFGACLRNGGGDFLQARTSLLKQICQSRRVKNKWCLTGSNLAQ